ncbi:MAG: tetratricopeptide repeat protein [Thermoanaerobaculaceae bacterium]
MRPTRSGSLAPAVLLLGLAAGAHAQDARLDGGDAGAPSAGVAAADNPCRQPLTAKRTRGLPARAAALIMSGQQGGGIGFSFLAAPLSSKAGSFTLGYLLDIDSSSLLGERRNAPTAVEVTVYAMGTGGAVSAASTTVFELEPDLCPELLTPPGFRLAGTLEVPESQHAIRILVRNLATGAFGVGELPRAVQAPAEGGGLAATPLAVEPVSFVQVVDSASAQHIQPLAAPAWIEAGKAVSTRPLVLAGKDVPLLLPGRAIPPGTRTLAARVLDRKGDLARNSELTVGERRGGALGMLDLWELGWKVPDLDPELYFLELTVPGALGGSTLQAVLPFIVVDTLAPPAPAVWAALDDVQVPEEPSLRDAYLASRGAKDEAHPRLKAGYREALARLGKEDVEAARTAIFELEKGSLVSGSPRELEGALFAELGVAKDLAGEQPDAALALALLHMQLYDRYVRGRVFIPQAHTRRIIEALTELWIRKRKTPEANNQGAELLAVLAGALQKASLDASAARLFKRAVEIDPACAPALLGLAAGLERSGAYRPAIRFLEQLVEASPDHAEARLRLAVNHLRVGSDGRAEKLLRSLFEGEVPVWVRVVAYQELARWLVGKGDSEAARKLLVRARERGVVDEQIDLQLAFTLDRLGRTGEAYELTARGAARGHGAGGASPRLRYAEWPSDDLRAARTRLDAALPSAMAALGEAVRRTSGEGSK